MSSPLESLPAKVFEMIYKDIRDSHTSLYTRNTSILNLSLTSKKCRSFTTRYIFRKLSFYGSEHQTLSDRLSNRVSDMKRLDLIHLVQVVDFLYCPLDNPSRIIKLLNEFPNLIVIWITSSSTIPVTFMDELQSMLTNRSPSGHYWEEIREARRYFAVYRP